MSKKRNPPNETLRTSRLGCLLPETNPECYAELSSAEYTVGRRNMTPNAQSLVAGISYYLEGSGLEISRALIRTYSHDDLAAAKEAIDHLQQEGAAFVVKPVDDAKDEEVCLVMLKYPGGKAPYAGWPRWFNQTLVASSLVPPEIAEASLFRE